MIFDLGGIKIPDKRPTPVYIQDRYFNKIPVKITFK